MQVVVCCRDGRVRRSTLSLPFGVFVSLPVSSRVYLIIEIRVFDVEFVRIDTYDRTCQVLSTVLKLCAKLRLTIFLVEFLNLVDEQAFLDYVEIELMPVGCSCESRTRELGKRMEIETVDCKAYTVNKQGNKRDLDSLDKAQYGHG